MIKRGAKRVTIIARRRDVLDAARDEILTHARDAATQKVEPLALDVGDAKESEQRLSELLEQLAASKGK